MNQRNHYSRKKRNLSVLAQRLQYLLKQQKDDLLDEIKKLILKIKHLVNELSVVFSRPVLAKALGATAFIFGILFVNQSQAQSFSAPVINPFGLVSTNNAADMAFVDLDNDGDLDLLIGEYYGAFTYFENNGTNASPAFKAPITNPFNLDSADSYAFISLADMDADGDMDMFVGEYNGALVYYENAGTATNPSFGSPVINPFGLSSTYYFAIPTLVDLDDDGDMDLLVGEYNGNMQYFENTGTSSSPQFASPQMNPFGISSVLGFASTDFADLDNDGDLDLLVGEYYGALKYFKNTGTHTNPQFMAPVTNPFGLDSAVNYGFPAFADLDNDGDMDLFLGEYYGNIKYYENLTTSPGFSDRSNEMEFVIYPNPAQEFLNIESKIQIDRVEVISIIGKTLISTTNSNMISLEGLVSGLYTVRIRSQKGDYYIRKFIKK